MGGIYELLDVIFCGLGPVRVRSEDWGRMQSTAVSRTTIETIIAWALTQIERRWTFYLTLPVSGLPLLAADLFIKGKYMRSPRWLKSSWAGRLVWKRCLHTVYHRYLAGRGTRRRPGSVENSIMSLLLKRKGDFPLFIYYYGVEAEKHYRDPCKWTKGLLMLLMLLMLPVLRCASTVRQFVSPRNVSSQTPLRRIEI